MNRLALGSAVVLVASVLVGPARAQTLAYPDPCLDYLYPAGGKQGETVAVQLGGLNGLAGATSVIVEGPPGVAASDVAAVNVGEVRATFTIAPDAPPGRRLVRVLGGANGLTNYRFFFVGRLPELLEAEPNNSAPAAQEVASPAVVNARIDPALDVDCFRFRAAAGQRIVAAVLAHGMDSKLRQSFNLGFLDTSLELADEAGAILAAAEDTLGLDPLVYHTVEADGWYTVRVRALSYKGAASAVYRLTLGEVPYPTSIFPPGGRRGEKVELEFSGPNIPPATRQAVAVPAEEPFDLEYVSLEGVTAGIQELPFLRGDFPEAVEREPNNERAAAVPLDLPVTANGRFDEPGDEDWYRLALKANQGVVLQTVAQRHLRSPVDTLLEIQGAAGGKLAENDDGRLFGGQCAHDVESADSWLAFTAPEEGDYFVRVRDQSGAAGPQAVYRLSAEPLAPDFLLYQWPDAVPIWGPGTTAAFVVQVFHWGGIKSDIALGIEGLPPGWTGSVGNLPVSYYGIMQPPYGLQVLLTITAPADAPPGATAPFRVVGQAHEEGRLIEHEAHYLTLYGNSHNDRMFLRASPAARAVVAGPLDCWLETSVRELAVDQGGTVEIPVKLHRRPDAKSQIGISVDGPTVAAGSGWRPPLALADDQTEVLLRLEVSAEWPPGRYPIVVSRSWTADLRAGRPGPCTPLILLDVLRPGGGKSP